MDDEDTPQALLELNTDEFPLYRVWPASAPILDTTPDPAHGTNGFHVHAWLSEVDYENGIKTLDQTYLEVRIDGVQVKVTHA